MNININIKPALAEDWVIINQIAHKTWPLTYGDVIPQPQLWYMLNLFYSEESLRNLINEKKQQCFIALNESGPVGFISVEEHFNQQDQMMIRKLYLLPEHQGKGYGKTLLEFITSQAIRTNHGLLRLKVFFKNQNAIRFYEHFGFSVQGDELMKIGREYSILDYIMTKRI